MRLLVVASVVLCANLANADLSPTDKAAARSLVDRWLDAQNRGDFAAYQALYAQQMVGIRRSGSKVVRMDRAGWLADRARMFKKKMTVGYSGLRAIQQGDRTRLLLTQTFESGTYKDVGAKELIVTGSPPLIVREEMLSSTLAGPALSRARAGTLAFAPLVDGKLVLMATAERSWGQSPSLLSDDRPVKVLSDVRSGSLPPALRLAGRSVRLFDAKGPRCEATVGPLRILTRVHLPMSAEPYRKMKKKQLVEEALQSGDSLLVAEVAGEGCTGALFGRALELPVPRLFVAEAAPAEIEAMAKVTVSKLYDLGGAVQSVQVIRVQEKELPKTLVVVQKGYGSRSDTWVVYELVGSGLVLRTHPASNNAPAPIGALDSDGDGLIELLFPENLLRATDGFYDEALVPPVPEHDLDLEQGC